MSELEKLQEQRNELWDVMDRCMQYCEDCTICKEINDINNKIKMCQTNPTNQVTIESEVAI